MTIRDALRQIHPEQGKRLAAEYFEESSSFPGTGIYTGSHFESFVGAPNPETEVTATDLIAVQALSVTVPSRASIGILGSYAPRISELLGDIKSTLKLEDVESEASFDALLGAESPALALWDLLRRNADGEDRWDVGPTIASKIMARKRPHLIPIDDSVVADLTGLNKKYSWLTWWQELRTDNYLTERAKEVREHVGRPDLSTLRALDIVLWKYGKQLGIKS